MGFEIQENATGTVLTLSGDINISSSSDLRAALSKAPTNLDLIIYSSELDYIDSSGVACLIMAYKQLAATGASVRLVDPSAALMNVLKILKFDSFFKVESA
ncbi:MAG: STAS domain-containing protein [Candidatus Puniceispirillaceae bacterium]